MQTVTPCLWFDGNAEEAVTFYLSVFPDGTILDTTKESGGRVITITFRLLGQTFMALNGGPHYRFTPAVSFFVGCDTQAEVDHLWATLTEGGSELRCGWLTDKFGVSWQVIPRALGTLLHDKDQQKSARVMTAMMKMARIDIAALTAAHEQS